MSRKPEPALRVVRQFQSEADAIREAPEPSGARATVFVLAGLLVSAVAVILSTKMDRIVTSTAGKIVPTALVNVFQPMDQSIIKSIDVREGDRVQRDQVLATFDPTFAAADVSQLRKQTASLETQIVRDEAELAGKPLVYSASTDPDFVSYAKIQKALYDQRIGQYQAQVTSYNEKIKQTDATIQKLEGDESAYQQREEVAKSIEEMRNSLAQSGSGSRLNLLLSQDNRLEMLRSVENSHNSLIESQRSLDSLKADREAFIQQWFSQLSQDLVTARNNLDDARAKLDKASRTAQLVRLTAPESSVVLTVAKVSVGSVLKAGDPFITLMPAHTPLEAEVDIASRDVGFVRQGDRCVLKIDAFNFVAHGTAEGTVRWISAGAFTTDENDKPIDPYYKARCTIDTTHFVNVPKNFELVPGMTLTADVNVGTRSVAMYLISGVMRGFGESMREP